MNSKKLISTAEHNDLDRLMLAWANQFPDIPETVMSISFEHFASKAVNMILSPVGATKKTDILGNYTVEYPFELHYQIAPTGSSDDKRLKANELLNAFGAWAETEKPDLGNGRAVLRVEATAYANYLGVTNDEYEEYMIPLKLTYEVNV